MKRNMLVVFLILLFGFALSSCRRDNYRSASDQVSTNAPESPSVNTLHIDNDTDSNRAQLSTEQAAPRFPRSDYPLEIKVKPPEPQRKKEIEFIVDNISNEVVSFVWVSIEKRSGDRWNTVRTDIECPCMAKCKKAIVELKTDEKIKATWDYKDSNCKTVGPGDYRAFISGQWDEKLQGNKPLGISDEFEL